MFFLLFFDVFLSVFVTSFCRFLTTFLTLFACFLTSFGGSVSRPAIGEESAHAFLVSRQSFHTKNVLFCFPSFIRAFILFLLFLEKKGKMQCNQKK